MRDWASILRRAMPFIDFGLVLFSFGAAYVLRYDVQLIRAVGEFNTSPFLPYIPYALIYGLWLVLTPPVVRLYRVQRGRSWLEEAYVVANGTTNATVVVMAVSFLLQPLVFSRLLILEATILSALLLIGLRLVHRTLQSALRQRGIGVERVLIVGVGEVGRAVMRNIVARPDLGYRVMGYLDDDPERGSVDTGRIRGFGGVDQLHSVLFDHEIDLIIVTLPWIARNKTAEIVAECAQQGIQTRVVPDLFQLNLSRVRVENLAGIPLLAFLGEPKLSDTKRLVKRTLDVSITLLALPFLALPLLFIALVIRLDSPGPVLYRHRRVGENGCEFDLFKFRSMYVDADKRHHDLVRETGSDPRHFKMKDDPRRTSVGKWIRRLSIDELPNLLNVLRGEMSLVGPRAPTPAEVALYEPWQRQRLNTLPGVTGLWQVSGRSDVPFEEMCLLDIYYIENWSLVMDIQIVLRTLPHVLMGSGAY
jgi:exopolysaccharide biosynthesis polyprenyl glycosylphosphotransferase